MTGADLGTHISFRTAGFYEVHHPWPEETVVSAGKGLVVVRGGQDYTTLFMEVYPPGASFIRGQGATPAECEDAAWAKYQLALHCLPERALSAQDHEWEPRGYRNGAGLCLHCDAFKAQAFTGEELGQHCLECGVGTTHHYEEDAEGGAVFGCKEHAALMPEMQRQKEKQARWEAEEAEASIAPDAALAELLDALASFGRDHHDASAREGADETTPREGD